MVAALALRIGCKRASAIRSLAPVDSEPLQVLQHGLHKLRPATLRIQILITKNQSAMVLGCSLGSRPECARMADMEKASRGRSEPPTMGIRDRISHWSERIL